MFTINRTLLQLVTRRKEWDKLRSSIHYDRFDKEVRAVLKHVQKYWQQHDTEYINIEVLASSFFLENVMEDSEREYYNKIFSIMEEEPDPDIARDIIRDLRLMEFSREIENANNDFILGNDIDLYETVRFNVQAFEDDIRRDADTGYCTASVQEVLEDEQHGSALEWQLDCLRRAMPGLRTGMQVIIAARPGKGKTSFLAHADVNFLQSDFLKATGRPIVWFNNEAKKIRIKGSHIRAALRMDFDQIGEIGWEEAERRYLEVVRSHDNIRVYDIHGKDFMYLERIMENDKPGVVVFDMLDNIHGFRSDREDQRLEKLYQWARECAVKYDFLSLPTSQISVEGDNMQWVPESCLKDSKTGKQGACDAIITIGSVHKEGFQNSRFIYVPKTKFKPATGFPADARTEVVFDPNRSLYLNPKLPT